MSDPGRSQESLDRAYEAMLADPAHVLAAAQRQQVYRLLATSDPPAAAQRRLQLDLLTAWRVLPLWARAWPHDPLPHLALALLADLLRGTLSPERLVPYAVEAVERIHTLTSTPTAHAQPSALLAGHAALVTLHRAGELEFFMPTDVYNDTGAPPTPAGSPDRSPREIAEARWNMWLDNTEPVTWAAAAVGGGLGYRAVDPAQQRVFWTWWVREAVPTVLQSAGPPAFLQTAPTWVLANADSTGHLARIFELARTVDYEFPVSIYDQGPPGRYQAALLAPHWDRLVAHQPIALATPVRFAFDAFFMRLARQTQQIYVHATPWDLVMAYPWGGAIVIRMDQFHAELETLLRAGLIAAGPAASRPLLAPPGTPELPAVLLESFMSGPAAVQYAVAEAVLRASRRSARFVAGALEQVRNGVVPLTWEDLARLLWGLLPTSPSPGL